jgi:hypothetical protein
MDLSLESDIYEPNTNDDGNYVDFLPPSSKFKHGLKCPCGSRKDHIFDSRQSFSSHIKSKTHLKWLSDLNKNKMNFFTECEKLKEIVSSQKLIIARLEKEVSNYTNSILKLVQQLPNKEHENSTEELMSLD